LKQDSPNNLMNIVPMSIHIGNIIRETVKRKGIRVTSFANEINCSRRNVYEIFRKKNIDTELLLVINEKLGENLFLYYLTENELSNYQNHKYAEFLIERLSSNEPLAAEPDHEYGTHSKASLQLLDIIRELQEEVNKLKNITKKL
jgi:plasmid maintenance system antidote protein VapI